MINCSEKAAKGWEFVKAMCFRTLPLKLSGLLLRLLVMIPLLSVSVKIQETIRIQERIFLNHCL